MGARIIALVTIRIDMAFRAGWVTAFSIMTDHAGFDVPLCQLRMTSAAGIAAYRGESCSLVTRRDNTAQRLTAIHMAIIAESLRIVAGLTISSMSLGINAMGEPIIDVVCHLSGQYRCVIISLRARRNHSNFFSLRKLREHGSIVALRTETLRMAITALGIHNIQTCEVGMLFLEAAK
jgi:hypothetical protein